MDDLSVRNQYHAGFSLIELLIAVSLFLVVTVGAIGSMISLQNAARRGEATYATLDNLNLAVDSMARLMRTGYNYHCNINATPIDTPQDCTYTATPYTGIPDAPSADDGRTSFAFKDQTGTQIQYKYDNSDSNAGFIAMRVGTGGWNRITSSDINIQYFRIYISGATANDTLQPYAVIVLAGQILQNGKVLSDFNVQTSMTQRLPDATP